MRFSLLAVALAPSYVIMACVGDTPEVTPGVDSGTDAAIASDTGNGATADASTDAATSPDADGGVALPSVGSLKLWFRADVGLSTTGAGVTWPDQGPFMVHAVAAADAGTSGYPTNKVNYFPNGMPAVAFDADPQLLRMPASPQFSDLTTGLSIFIAGIPTASKAGQWISFGASTSSNRVTLGQNGNVIQVALGATVYTANGPNALVPVNEHHVFAATIRGSGGADSIAFYRDDKAAGVANGTALKDENRALSTLGGSEGGGAINTAPIGIGEVLVYGKVVSPGERSDIEAYLKARWGTR